MSEPITHVVIAVPTLGSRPVDALLEQLVAQAHAQLATVDVVVLDNSAASSAQVRRSAESAGTDYVHVGTPGVASVRNAALDELIARGADTLVFIDDDELPSEGWLAAHLSVAERFGADVVLGPVPVAVPDDAPRWLDGGRVLRAVPDRPDGLFDSYVNAGNTLVRREILNRTGARFDTAFDLTGGEDIVFFSVLRTAGAVVAWSRDAVAVETQDADRLTVRGFARRLFEFGQRSVLVERRVDGTGALRTVVRRGYRMLRGVGVGVGGLVTGRPATAVRGLGDIAFGWGSLTAVAGLRPRSYGR